MNSFLFVYLVFDVVLIIFSLFKGGLWLINTQVAFICSMFILFASFNSYKSMIYKKLALGESTSLKDHSAPNDDKYNLYDEEQEEDMPVNSEKLTSAKQSFSNLMASWSFALGIFRLLAYGILVICMLVLIRKDMLEPLAFLLGLGIMPIATLYGAFLRRNES